jgi:hypothetical protein
MTHSLRWERRAALIVLPITVSIALALAPTGCKNRKVRVQATDEEAPRMASAVSMGDPKADTQLAAGLYGVEAGAWRWTAKQFAVVLRPPSGSALRGAKLELKLTVPPVVIEQLKAISLSATANGSALPPETYTQTGDYVYTRDVPAGALTGDSVLIAFRLDKAMPPSGSDMRELGIIVLSAGLESK